MRSILFFISVVYISTLIGCQLQEAEQPILFPREFNTTYQIDPAKDTTITAENGTILEIPALAFIGEDGQTPGGTIELAFADFYDKSDFVLNRLSTQTTDGRLLQSSGMVYLDANSGSKQLKLKDNKSIRIKFRRTFQSPAAGLFYGKEKESGLIEWVETGDVYQDSVLLFDYMRVKMNNETSEDTVTYIYPRMLIGKDTIDDFDSVSLSLFQENNPDKIIYSFPSKIDSIPLSFKNTYPKDIYFTFNSLQLGWINCDDFINQDTHEFRVNIPEILTNVELYMVFDSLNSVMSGTYIADQEEDHFSFQVPDNLDVTLVAWKYDPEMPMFAMLKSNTSKRQKALTLKPMPADSIKLIIQESL